MTPKYFDQVDNFNEALFVRLLSICQEEPDPNSLWEVLATLVASLAIDIADHPDRAGHALRAMAEALNGAIAGVPEKWAEARASKRPN